MGSKIKVRFPMKAEITLKYKDQNNNETKGPGELLSKTNETLVKT